MSTRRWFQRYSSWRRRVSSSLVKGWVHSTPELVGTGDVARQLVPRDLVDHRHRPLGAQAVERLPLADPLLLDGQRGELGDLRGELADDGDVGGGEAGAGLGGHR